MQLDRRTFLLLSAVAASPWPVSARQAGPDAALDSVFAAKAPVGLAGGIVGRDGLTWSGRRGRKSIAADTPLDAHERWHLGSNTKALAAALLVRLHEKGRLDHDAPLRDLLGGGPIDTAWTKVTPLDLMRHHAGLIDRPHLGPEWVMGARFDPRSPVEQRRALLQAAMGAPPAGAAGVYSYGNLNYVILTALIERVVGETWWSLLTRELLEPLGIRSAGQGAPTTTASGAPNALGHFGMGDGRRPMPADQPFADNPLAIGGAGSVHMTLPDYARFLTVFLRGGEGLVSAKGFATLTEPLPGERYAGGWGVRTSDGAVILSHEGSNTLWHARAVVNLSASRAAIAFTNESPLNGSPRDLTAALQLI